MVSHISGVLFFGNVKSVLLFIHNFADNDMFVHLCYFISYMCTQICIYSENVNIYCKRMV